jgi:hypothetical protein
MEVEKLIRNYNNSVTVKKNFVGRLKQNKFNIKGEREYIMCLESEIELLQIVISDLKNIK